MKLSVVALNVVLVAAGIFVYDAVRGGGDEPSSVPPSVRSIDRGEEQTDEAPPPITLRGVGDQALLAELQRRVAALEAGKPGEAIRLEAVADGGYEGANGRLATEGGLLPEGADPENKESFERRDLDTFRAMLDIVEQERRDDQQRQRIARGLNRIEVALTDRQKQDVIDATISYQEKIRDAFRSGEMGTREERQASMQTLRDEFSQTVYSLVPSAEAEKITENVRRLTGFGGFSGGRVGGGGSGGRRGGGR